MAARSRPGDDETLMRIWAPSRARICGTVRCQKSSQIPMPSPTPEPRRHRPQHVARPEEPALVEQPVGRQEQLAVDVPDLAVLEQGGGDEQPMVGRFLDERDDRREVLGRGRQLGQARVVEAQGDLGREVLELVAGQAELREDDEVGLVRAGLVEELVMAPQVAVQLPEAGRQLGEGHADRLHGREHTRSPA